MLLADRAPHFLVCMLGAAAHGLVLGLRGLVRAADRGREYLLDQSRARAARARGLGVLAHVVEREEPLLLDRLDDGAFAHAIAAADLHRVGHRGGLVLPLVAAVAQMRLAEH